MSDPEVKWGQFVWFVLLLLVVRYGRGGDDLDGFCIFFAGAAFGSFLDSLDAYLNRERK